MELEIKNLKKYYGKVKALNGINLKLTPGIYGLLGPNGAGKSTLIGLITDNIKRDKAGGEILYDGTDILKLGKSFRKRVGYMPQQQGFYEEFTAYDFLKYMAEIKEVPKKDINKEIDDLLAMVNLTSVAHRKVGTFSGGMRQRVLLAQALIGNPDILILDEPTAGLDPKERINIRNFIADLARNKIILYATHVVSDVECIADKIILLKNGEIIKDDSPRKLIEEMYGKTAEISCEYSDIAKYREWWGIGSISQAECGVLVRLVQRSGNEIEFPGEIQKSDERVTLEDVYLYYFG